MVEADRSNVDGLEDVGVEQPPKSCTHPPNPCERQTLGSVRKARPDDPAGTAVTVRLDVTSAIGATIVPAEALVSRLDGSYAVQVGAPDGPHEFVPVTVIAVSGGDVAVQSDQLGEGMTILVPV